MHQTERIVLKTADIDKAMVPIVKWLNSFDNVYTISCCQGRYKGLPPNNVPIFGFVSWITCEVDHSALIKKIIKIFDMFGVITKQHRNWKVGTRFYMVEWPSEQALEDTVNFIKKEVNV